MSLRKGHIAIVGLIVALIAMVVSMYVPHHHHKETICIGDYDCKNTKHHSHHDECGGKDESGSCYLDRAYLDFRTLDEDQSVCSFESQQHLIAIIGTWLNDEFYGCREASQHAIFQPRTVVVPVLRLETRRGPPAQFVICES